MIIQSAEIERLINHLTLYITERKNVLSYEKELTERFLIIRIYLKSEIFQSQMSYPSWEF